MQNEVSKITNYTILKMFVKLSNGQTHEVAHGETFTAPQGTTITHTRFNFSRFKPVTKYKTPTKEHRED